MSFADDVDRFRQKTMARALAVRDAVGDLTFASIVEGSPITGAPGQPVDTGNLKGSWQTVFLSRWRRVILTKVIYAQQIEDGTRAGRALVLRSPVGGFHSVALTRLGWQRIVDAANAQVPQ